VTGVVLPESEVNVAEQAVVVFTPFDVVVSRYWMVAENVAVYAAPLVPAARVAPGTRNLGSPAESAVGALVDETIWPPTDVSRVGVVEGVVERTVAPLETVREPPLNAIEVPLGGLAGRLR
jgi:hypothetical protein